MFTAFIVLFMPVVSAGGVDPIPAPELGRVIYHCKSPLAAPLPEKHVWLLKQWHADPGVDTHDLKKAKKLPQAANQTAVYRQLDQWIGKQLLKTLIAEGCSGELTVESKLNFNGWTAESLQVEAGKIGFDQLVAHVPLKLEAKYGAKLRTLCGDDDLLIREHLRAFSDVRGTYGFMSRLLQHKDDPERAKVYLEGVIELYKLPPKTNIRLALDRLRKELRDAMDRLHAALDRRNDRVVSTIKAVGNGPVGVVYGGIHALGIIKRLETLGIGCSVIEPAGYRNDEAALMEQLETAISKL